MEQIRGEQKWRRNHGERRPSRGGEIKTLDDKMMKIAMVCGRKIFHIFSMHHKMVGLERKRKFLEKLSDNIHDVPHEDLLMVAGDMNCHTEPKRDGFEDVMGCFSFAVRKEEGENMLR